MVQDSSSAVLLRSNVDENDKVVAPSSTALVAHLVMFNEGSAQHVNWINNASITIQIRHCVIFVLETNNPMRLCDGKNAPGAGAMSYPCDFVIRGGVSIDSFENGNEMVTLRTGPSRSLFWLLSPAGQTVRGSTFFRDCSDIQLWDAQSLLDEGGSASSSIPPKTWRYVSVPSTIRQRLLKFLKCDGVYSEEIHPNAQFTPFDCHPFAFYLAGVNYCSQTFEWNRGTVMPPSYIAQAGDIGIVIDDRDKAVHVFMFLEADITISRFGNADIIIVASPDSVLLSYSALGGKKIVTWRDTKTIE